MAPIKFEENIKDKLDDRSLKPSVNAWNNLEQRLDAQDKKQKGKVFWWFGLAASIISIFLITQQFMSVDFQNEKLAPVIVDTKNEEFKTRISNNQIVKEEQEKNVISIKESNSKIKKDKVLIKSDQISLKENPIVKAEVIEDETIQNEITLPDVEISNNGIGHTSIVESSPLEDSDNAIANVEIDALLEQAKQNIIKEDRSDTRTKAVDANELLLGIEGDIEHSFRGKAIKIIETNYKTIKNAVATRND